MSILNFFMAVRFFLIRYGKSNMKNVTWSDGIYIVIHEVIVFHEDCTLVITFVLFNMFYFFLNI